MLPGGCYKHIYRVSSVDAVRDAKKSIKKDAALIWVDLTGKLTDDDISGMHKELQSAKAMRKNAHLILTCDDELIGDEPRAKMATIMSTEFEFESLRSCQYPMFSTSDSYQSLIFRTLFSEKC